MSGPLPRPTDFRGWKRWIEQWLQNLDNRIVVVGSRPGTLVLEPAGTVPDGTPVNTVIYRKGVGLLGWWDGATIVAF